MAYESVVVVLATQGATLERDALDALPETAVTWCRVEREGRVACLAAPPKSPFRISPLVRQLDALAWYGAGLVPHHSHVPPRSISNPLRQHGTHAARGGFFVR